MLQNTPDTSAPVAMITCFAQLETFWAAENITGTLHDILNRSDLHRPMVGASSFDDLIRAGRYPGPNGTPSAYHRTTITVHTTSKTTA